MRLLTSHAISCSLACALGLGLVAQNSNADEPAQKLKPVPESKVMPKQGVTHYHGTHGHVQGTHIDGGYVDGGYVDGGYVDGGHYGEGHGVFGRNRRPSPGTGWCAPSKVTQQRLRVEYWKYYPHYWSGYGPGPVTPYHPMVYTPTDTAQLGFYYQHAPSWTAQPWRTPGPAHPAVWHNRYCGRCQNGYGYNAGYEAYPTTASTGGVYYDGQEQIIHTSPVQPNEVEQMPKANDQSILLPEPSFVPRAPRLSIVPDAPPEI